MKKITALLSLGLILSSPHVSIIATQNEFSSLQSDSNWDDDFTIDNDLNDLDLKNIETPTLTRGTTEDNADAWSVFFLGVVTDPNAVFNQSIYIKTSPIRIRPILEYPFSLTYGFDLQDHNACSFAMYLNTTSEKIFTNDSPYLSSYLNLTSLNFLENSAEGSLDLFGPAKVYEARIGGLLQSHIKYSQWNVTMQLPLAYTARKISLTDEEQAAIADTSVGQTLESNSGGDIDAFKRSHFGVDQFGFGDFKIKAMCQIHESDTFNAYVGGFAIFPTAVATKTAINGAWLEQNNERAYLNLLTIDPSAFLTPENLTSQNKTDLANFLIAALDKLNSNILYSPLGNNGHTVFAVSENFDWLFAQNWKWSNDLSLQIPLRAYEQRYFTRTQTEEGFTAEFNAAADASSTDLVLFVNQKIQDSLFPYVISTKVFPGIVINSTNQFIYNLKDWDFMIGSNFWFQGEESLQDINASNNGLPNNSTYSYDIIGATASSVWQEKLLTKINYNFDSTSNSWSLGLYGDITVLNSGIGNDFTLGMTVDCKF